MGQADEAAAGNQSEIRCLSRLEPCRCLRETVRNGTGTPPRETMRAMFASALGERNGQASDGILGRVPGVTGGREGIDALGQREQTRSHGRKARLRTGWSGLQRSGTALGHGREDAATAATELELHGKGTDAR